jgi:hypothetical protein
LSLHQDLFPEPYHGYAVLRVTQSERKKKKKKRKGKKEGKGYIQIGRIIAFFSGTVCDLQRYLILPS